MKKLLLMCCVLVGISAVSHAQGRQQRSPADQAAALKTSLALTDDQTAKITAIYTAQAKTTDSLRAAGADRAAMAPVRTATMAKVKAVLTPDQAAAFDKQQAEIRARMQQGGGGGAPPTPQK
ncbi:MAG TPA: hypothetical protein VGC01_01790 [Mucilaginibacter sp.]